MRGYGACDRGKGFCPPEKKFAKIGSGFVYYTTRLR